MVTNKKEIMSLGFRVNNVIYSKSSGKIWSLHVKPCGRAGRLPSVTRAHIID